jgi:nucleotide-binding universal stress UspA family protein
MNAGPSAAGTRRIAVALDASAYGQQVLDLAAAVAALLAAELEGVFVEDTQLIHSAGLPFLRELRRTTLDESALDVSRLQRELRANARRVRETLEQSARTRGLACSFRVWRGDLGAEILAAGVDAELFALGRIGRFAPLGRHSRGVLARQRGGLTIGVLFNGSESAERALATAAELAYDNRAAICVILQFQAGQDVVALRALATAVLSGIETSIQEFSPASSESGNLARAIPALGIDLLIVDSTNPLLAAPILWETLESIDCPILIQRAAS